MTINPEIVDRVLEYLVNERVPMLQTNREYRERADFRSQEREDLIRELKWAQAELKEENLAKGPGVDYV